MPLFRTPSARLATGFVIALAVAGAASAEMRVRVQNDTPNPATFTVEGKSKDVRPRKAMTYPITSLTPPFTVVFANGMADRGELDLGYATPVVGAEDGAEYRCISLQEKGIEITEPEDCDKKVNKPKD